MKKFLTALFIVIGFVTQAQTYNPSNFTVSNKSYGVAQAGSTDARSFFYDAGNFIMRDYQDTTEVNNYLNLAKYRSGHFPIFVHKGGTLSGGGVWIGGITQVWWYKDSTGRANVVRWYTDSVATTGVFFAIANNLSEGNATTMRANLVLDQVNNTSDATKNAATVALTNHTIDASLNTLLHIPNSSLNNSTIGLTLDATGTDVTITGSPASLGGSFAAHIPSASSSNRGVLTNTDWSSFSGKVDSTQLRGGDSIFDWHNGTAVFRYISPVLTGANNGLSVSTGSAVLGQAVGAGGSPGKLLSTREIPLNGFNIGLSGTGNFIIGSTVDSTQQLQVNGNVAQFGTSNVVQHMIKLPGSQTVGVPYFLVKNSTADSVFAISSNSKYNLFIGVGSGANNAVPAGAFNPGGSNVGIGGPTNSSPAALGSNTTGAGNTAIGGSAMSMNTTGVNNTAVGLNAMFATTTGTINAAFGQAALAFNTTGTANAAIGQDASRQNTAGINNTAIGTGALQGNQTGSSNTAVGAAALGTAAESTISTMSQNTALGFGAGRSTVSIGTANLFLGYLNSAFATVGSNNTFIGSNVVPRASLSNTVILADGAGNQRLFIDSSGNVGIATTTPVYKLDVNGAAIVRDTMRLSNVPTGGNTDSVLVKKSDGVIYKVLRVLDSSGVYTPSITLNSNVTSATASQLQFMRVGSVVTVSGFISTSVTTGGVGSVITVPLPIASTFSSVSNCGGGAGSDEAPVGLIRITAATGGANKAQFDYTAVSAGTFNISFSFTYLII